MTSATCEADCDSHNGQPRDYRSGNHEVHALNLHEQAQFEHRLAELRVSRRSSALRIMASSSAPLFDRVRDGSFDERLYYRLNVIHVVVG